MGYVLPPVERRVHPLLQEGNDSLPRIRGGKSRSSSGYLAPNVHLVGNQHGLAAGESLDDGDPEVFLMTGKHKGLAAIQRTPFRISLKYSCEMDGCLKAIIHGSWKLGTKLVGTRAEDCRRQLRSGGTGFREESAVNW